VTVMWYFENRRKTSKAEIADALNLHILYT